MNLKKLSSYQEFNHVKFFEGKKLVLADIKYDDEKELVKGTLAIIEDSENENLFAKVNFRLIGKSKDSIKNYSLGAPYKISGIEKCSVYGQYSDNLSIICKELLNDNSKA